MSILFADLESFTSFAERTEPAEVAAMLNRYFEDTVPLVMEQFGGEVHQLIGDEIMVIFNKQGNQPDHAVRASAAALALQTEAERIASEHPEWPRFRVGVNSGGDVAGVMGARGKRHHGVVGDTVNLAARLQRQARAGEVVIGAGTYERLTDGAHAEALPQLHVKGKEKPVAAYVLRAVADGGAGKRAPER